MEAIFRTLLMMIYRILITLEKEVNHKSTIESLEQKFKI